MRSNAWNRMESSGCLWRMTIGLCVILGLVAGYLALSRAYSGGESTIVPTTPADHHDDPGR